MESEELSFLTATDEALILEAIHRAEQKTSGEIRVHIENICPEPPMDRAIHLFGELNMHRTAKRNGVLVYLAIDDHTLTIYGDLGIHERVGTTFWQDVLTLMLQHFKQGQFGIGLSEGILLIGKKLSEFFPADREYTNELPNEISYHRH